MNKMTDKRDLRLDLFRIFCMYLICITHAVGYDHSRWTHPLASLSFAGVIGFVLISGYFGIRFSWGKVIRLELTALFWAFGVSLLGEGIEKSTFQVLNASVLHQTIAIWKWYWFVHAYVLLMCLAPLVPDIRTCKPMLIRAFSPMILAVYGWSFLSLVPGIQAYVPQTFGLTAYSGLTLFAVYLIGRLYRAFDGDRLNAGLVYPIAAVGGLVAVASGHCCLHWGGVLARYNSPFLLAFGLGLFFLFRRAMPAAFPGVLVNRIIVLITPSILSVYLIHCNSYGYKALGYLEGYFLWCPMELRVLMMALIAFIVCIVLDVPRRIVVKLVALCSNKCPVGGRYE